MDRFVADGRLEGAGGGRGDTLADSVAGGFGGAAGLADGTLVYVTPSLQGLRRVSGAGWAGRVALPEAAIGGGGGIGMPNALPGARGVLFIYCSATCLGSGLHVLDLHTGKEKPCRTTCRGRGICRLPAALRAPGRCSHGRAVRPS
jgi:hypothetical protein